MKTWKFIFRLFIFHQNPLPRTQRRDCYQGRPQASDPLAEVSVDIIYFVYWINSSTSIFTFSRNSYKLSMWVLGQRKVSAGSFRKSYDCSNPRKVFVFSRKIRLPGANFIKWKDFSCSIQSNKKRFYLTSWHKFSTICRLNNFLRHHSLISPNGESNLTALL